MTDLKETTTTHLEVGALVRYKGDPRLIRRVIRADGNGSVVVEPGGYYNAEALEVIRRSEIDGVIIEGPDA